MRNPSTIRIIGLAILASGAAAATLAVGSGIWSRSAPAAPTAFEAQPSARTRPLAVDHTAQPVDAARPPESPRRTASLVRAFATTLDLRSFSLSALKQPRSGGVFYAAQAVRWCAHVRGGHPDLQAPQPATPPQAGPRQQMAQLQARCASFADDELTAQRLDTLYGEADTQGDPLAKLPLRLHREGRSPDPALREAAVAAVLATADPWLFEDIGWRLSLGAMKQGGMAVWFDGQPYPLSEDPAIAAAYSLVPCRLGLPCDATDLTLALPCAVEAECFTSREEKLRRTLGRDDPARWAEILQWTDRIVAAIRTGRASAFSRRS